MGNSKIKIELSINHKHNTMSTALIAIEDMTMLRAAVIEKRINNSVFAGMKAMMSEQLKEKMRNGVAHFFFVKKNGELREAWGTTCKSLAEKHINGRGESREHYSTTAFFDIECGKWKSLRWESIVKVC